MYNSSPESIAKRIQLTVGENDIFNHCTHPNKGNYQNTRGLDVALKGMVLDP